MKKIISKIDLKLLIIFIGLFSLSILTFYYSEFAKIHVRKFLESDLTKFVIYALIIILFVLHYFKCKQNEYDNEAIITKRFGIFFDNAFGGIAYATIFYTGLTLLKGLFIQFFFTDKIFFYEFSMIDTIAIFGVIIFTLFFVALKIVEIATETFRKHNTETVLTEKREPVLKEEVIE